MSDPTSKLNSTPQLSSPPVEAQRQLMAKAHPEKKAGDLCLGVVKQNGGEFLVYSSDDHGGVCHVGDLQGERVGYVSDAEVKNFIARYSPKPKSPPTARGITNLVAPAVKSTFLVHETLAFASERMERKIQSIRGEYFEMIFSRAETRIFNDPPIMGLCEYFKQIQNLDKETEKVLAEVCPKNPPVKTPTKAPARALEEAPLKLQLLQR